jgi:hypothetical protein
MRRFTTLVAGVALGLAPALGLAAPNPSPPDQTQTPSIPDATIGKAGAALHDVAQLQKKYEGKMASASPAQKQSLNEQANAEAMQAIQSHGLSVQEYSNVIHVAQNDPQTKQRLLSAAKIQN